MDLAETYHFLFETMPGIAVLIGAGLVISVLVCVVLEVRTRKRFPNCAAPEEDEWSILSDDEEDEG